MSLTPTSLLDFQPQTTNQEGKKTWFCLQQFKNFTHNIVLLSLLFFMNAKTKSPIAIHQETLSESLQPKPLWTSFEATH
jgi:hypothetical protein